MDGTISPLSEVLRSYTDSIPYIFIYIPPANLNCKTSNTSSANCGGSIITNLASPIIKTVDHTTHTMHNSSQLLLRVIIPSCLFVCLDSLRIGQSSNLSIRSLSGFLGLTPKTRDRSNIFNVGCCPHWWSIESLVYLRNKMKVRERERGDVIFVWWSHWLKWLIRNSKSMKVWSLLSIIDK